MRILVALVFLLAAAWRAALDWRATIGEGYAYRLTPIGRAFSDTWPDGYESFVAALRDGGVPWLWHPVGETVMALPLALVLAIVAALVWFTRRRRR